MIDISVALPNEVNSIQEIARKTWPVAYADILSSAQLEFMLNKFYSVEALNANLDAGHQFLLARLNSVAVGFAGFEFNSKQIGNTHLHKIYVLPEMQGKHIGEQLIEIVERLALKKSQKSISLNVNRNNRAITFYEKLGFAIAESVDIEIGNGYLMEDYVMRKFIV